MVHALQEAHRVLKTDGMLIDLRPAAKHRRVGLGTGRRWRIVGVMRENFDDDLAADRAVAETLRAGWYRRESRIAFNLDRIMDTLAEFRAWLDDFGGSGKLPTHKWLVQRLTSAQMKGIRDRKVTVRGPLMLTVLRKLALNEDKN